MKALGYGLSIAGVAVVILSGKIASLSFLKSIPKMLAYTVVAGIILIIAGIFLLIDSSSSSSKQAEEVPIYEGEGKKRVIVGYQKMKAK